MTNLTEDLRAIREALEAGPTPGPWTHGEYKGYCIDWVRTLHADWQDRHNAAFVADIAVDAPEVCQTGNAHGQEGLPQHWPANAAYIAACSPDRIARLVSALEGAMVDAERYRAVRGDGVTSCGQPLRDFCFDDDGSLLHSHDLDAAIDAARKEQP